MMNQLFGNSLLFGGNAPFVEELYENYLDNPGSVSEQWREYFDKLAQLPGHVARDVPHLPVINAFAEQARKGGYRAAAVAPADDKKQVGILQMITAYRFAGDRWANLDPLKRTPRPVLPQLDPAHYGLSDADLNTMFAVGSFKGVPERATFGQILDALKATYCGSIGVEYMYLSTLAEKRWLQDRLERIHSKPSYTAGERMRMLERLTAAETLERYLHTRYVGQKRFSLEGGESLIVALDELIRVAGTGGVDEIVVGMAHRGRLNVLVNTLGKEPSMLFDEFEGKKAQDLTAGDVKYHMGYSSDVSTPGGPCHLTLSFNPSHLEIVNPVVVGSVYSRQRRRGEDGKDKVLAVLIHGDAAVAGQGVNQEMLNFAQTRGYGVGGTVHIVVNNQIGFTTSDPRDYRSSLYCTDIFKMAEAPIFHVNGDDPEAVALVTGIAMEYRKTFKKDVVVDIVCYRKLGHNEQDEPMVTQPLMYKKIQQHPGRASSTRKSWLARGFWRRKARTRSSPTIAPISTVASSCTTRCLPVTSIR
jgi:2-oxoglutarate dehydrogenase E1 component